MQKIIKKLFGLFKSEPPPSYEVTFDDQGVRTMLNGKAHESVSWDDLMAAGIRIENDYLPIPYWVLFGQKGGCLYPSDAIGNEAILAELQRRLSGFNNEAVIEAMGKLKGTVVWTRSGRPLGT